MTELDTLRERCKQTIAGFVLASGGVTILALVLFQCLGHRWLAPFESEVSEHQELAIFLAMFATVIIPNVIISFLAVRWFRKQAVCMTCKAYVGLPLIKRSGTCPKCGFTWETPER